MNQIGFRPSHIVALKKPCRASGPQPQVRGKSLSLNISQEYPTYLVKSAFSITFSYRKFIYTRKIDELPRPRRALRASTPLERAESFGREDELGLPYSFALQNHIYSYYALFSKLRVPFVVEVPILPIANPCNIRPSRLSRDLPLSDFRRSSQKGIQSRIKLPRNSNPPNAAA